MSAKKSTGQMWLGVFPKITIAHGQEWLWAHDSAGYGRFFARKVGSAGPFYNEYAGPPDDPRSSCGNGEYVNEYGELVPCP